MCCAFLNFRGLSGCTHAPVSADRPTAHEGCMVLVSSHWQSLGGAPAASGKAEGGCQGSISHPAPLLRRSSRLLEFRAPCQGELVFRMQGAATELWCGVRVEVDGVFLRRLCCFAMLILEKKT